MRHLYKNGAQYGTTSSWSVRSNAPAFIQRHRTLSSMPTAQITLSCTCWSSVAATLSTAVVLQPYPISGVKGPPGDPGVGLLQTVSYQTGAVATGTTIIPFDDTIPQITEGNEFMTLAITPRSATSQTDDRGGCGRCHRRSPLPSWCGAVSRRHRQCFGGHLLSSANRHSSGQSFRSGTRCEWHDVSHHVPGAVGPNTAGTTRSTAQGLALRRRHGLQHRHPGGAVVAAIDFPASPTNGQVFVAGNGVTYVWNGTLWLAGTTASMSSDTPPSQSDDQPTLVQLGARAVVHLL